MAHSSQQQQSPPSSQQPAAMGQGQLQGQVLQQSPPLSRQKRKREDTTNNERLSKRLSLLNLERNGPKLYVPVEAPDPYSASSTSAFASASAPAPPLRGNHSRSRRTSATSGPRSDLADQMQMQMDDSKHKVYIYNLDDELSSSESEPEDGRIMFHPDIQRHLMATRIPPVVKASPEGQLAGMELVLYREPTALTVPESQDSVRKAVIEARKRIRDKQRHDTEVAAEAGAALASPVVSSQTFTPSPPLSSSTPSSSFSHLSQPFISPTSPFITHDVMSPEPCSFTTLQQQPHEQYHQQSQPSFQQYQHQSEADPDAMEMDLD